MDFDKKDLEDEARYLRYLDYLKALKKVLKDFDEYVEEANKIVRADSSFKDVVALMTPRTSKS